MWNELHTRAVATVAAQTVCSAAEQRWLAFFAARIPCKGCRAHWRALVAAHPPDLATPAAFFVWTVRAHNAVNRSLGKPALPLADACRLYGVALTPAPL